MSESKMELQWDVGLHISRGRALAFTVFTQLSAILENKRHIWEKEI